jgi:flagellar biosynthesis GTPase FlhF
MNEADDYLKMMHEATAMRGSELKSQFKTMLFSYRNALGMLSGLKNELDEVVNHIDNLDIETISNFYKPVLDKANDLVSKIEDLEYEMKNHSDMKAYLSSIKTQLKSHNIDTWVKKLDEVKYQIIKAKENEIRRQREAKEAEERRKQELQRQRNEEAKRQAEFERQRREEIVTFNGLMWEKETRKMNWNDAMEYAKNLRLGGYSDWRLPTVDELKEVVRSCGGTSVEHSDKNFYSILDKNKANFSYQSCYKNKGFKNDDWYWYWGSTSISGGTDYGWLVDFDNGGVYYYRKDGNDYLRCVRVG